MGDAVLADFPVELRPHIRRYYEARNAANEACGPLRLAKVLHRIDWWKIDRALRALAS
jgi:hypothetical protein